MEAAESLLSRDGLRGSKDIYITYCYITIIFFCHLLIIVFFSQYFVKCEMTAAALKVQWYWYW